MTLPTSNRTTTRPPRLWEGPVHFPRRSDGCEPGDIPVPNEASTVRAAMDATDIAAEVERRQRARLKRAPGPGPKPSPWTHVPLADLFAQAGNRVHRRGDGLAESGHEPFHGSKSGRCVLIDPATGRWWCRSCRTSGDAARLLMDLRGCSYSQAETWMARHYGPPADRPTRPRPRWLKA
jgi:hypothetical protein